MYKLNIYLLVSAFFLIFSGQSLSQELVKKSDFEQPLRLASDKNFADGKEKTGLYEGNVKITQGSLSIEANKVQIVAGEGQGREVFIATGNPASYTQQLADGSMVTARANEIKYVKIDRTISLKGNAELLQNAFSIEGDSIIFDMEKEQVLANTNENSDSQVVTIFNPESIKKTKESIENNKQQDNEGQ
ncbi:lipopolysaccharide transport periplasmic protein LptA [Glaciecola sp. MH2013]|uniref:lipopolysaccharide transport periplasmic protein LptA n=1 Tax=Glaciecola sp. MH2013 TaxID=2785524 RepID=UPI0018A019F8|nr:lipopolysaccharide transport periplasmic protein LptA [Glaciecola sp. MH2013]MBF7074914.1 lipopolysaccharide transport periplasmic protein LptA [Glaciecola sp. MH2013]